MFRRRNIFAQSWHISQLWMRALFWPFLGSVKKLTDLFRVRKKNWPTFWGRSKNLTDFLKLVKKIWPTFLGSVKMLSDLLWSLKKIDRPFGVSQKIDRRFGAGQKNWAIFRGRSKKLTNLLVSVKTVDLLESVKISTDLLTQVNKKKIYRPLGLG